jgi:hypothetical protein
LDFLQQPVLPHPGVLWPDNGRVFGVLDRVFQGLKVSMQVAPSLRQA